MSKGHSTEIGYKIEVRVSHFLYSRPLVLHDGVVSTEWREVVPASDNNPAGVPVETLPFGNKSKHGLLPYESAVALAWTLIAQNSFAFDLECRLVQYKLETDYTLEKEGIVDQVFKHTLFKEIALEKDASAAISDNSRS